MHAPSGVVTSTVPALSAGLPEAPSHIMSIFQPFES